MQTQKLAEENCSLCGYEVTSPACASCLKRQISNFIGNKEELEQDVMEIVESVKVLDGDHHSCIYCGDPVETCAFCFNKEFHNVLSRGNVIESEEFGRLFQCDEELQEFFNHYF
jgi:hypothetical protein